MVNKNIDQDGLEEFMPGKQVTGLINKSRPTLYRWVKAGIFPAPYKIGGSSLWKKSEYKEWSRNLKR